MVSQHHTKFIQIRTKFRVVGGACTRPACSTILDAENTRAILFVRTASRRAIGKPMVPPNSRGRRVAPQLGFGHIVVSEKETPNLSVNMV